MAQVERDPQRRVERTEEQREEPWVGRLLDRHAERAEPVAEEGEPLLEHAELPGEAAGELDGELEPVRRLRGPADEVPLGRQAIAGRVQLDRRQPLRVAPEELLGPRVRG